MVNQKAIKKKIIELLEQVKIFINNEGGDVNFVSFIKGVLTLEISGACVGCIGFNSTYNYGIKVSLMETIPEIKDVIFVVATK